MLVFRDGQQQGHIAYVPGESVGGGSAPDLACRSWRYQVKASGVSEDVKARICKIWEASEQAGSTAIAAGAPTGPEVGVAAKAVERREGTACPSTISGRRESHSRREDLSGVLPEVRRLNGGRVSVWAGGRVSRLHVDRDNGLTRLEPKEQDREQAKRGEIAGFSWRSRNRLLELISKINREKVEVDRWRFVTLTYRNQQITARQSKRHVKMLHKRLCRFFGPVAVIWKLEPHPGGKPQPHYHLLLLLPDTWERNLLAEREAFARAWVEVTNEGGWDEEQYKVNTFGGDHEDGEKNYKAAWQAMHSWEEVVSYTGKYVAKVHTDALPETFTKAGRWWGCMKWDLVPVDEIAVQLAADPVAKVQRVLRKLANAKVRGQYFVAGTAETFHLSPTAAKAYRRAGMKLCAKKPWARPGRSCRFFGEPLEVWRLVLWAEGKEYPKAKPLPDIPF